MDVGLPVLKNSSIDMGSPGLSRVGKVAVVGVIAIAGIFGTAWWWLFIASGATVNMVVIAKRGDRPGAGWTAAVCAISVLAIGAVAYGLATRRY